MFNSILIDLKQQGLFDMIKKLMNENKIDLGKRFTFEEKYKPFTPNLNGKNSQNHIKTFLNSDHKSISDPLVIWLNSLEFEKVFKYNNNAKDKILAKELPEDLIFEKIIPKIIDANTLNFNIKKEGNYKEVFELDNYYLNKVIE